MASDHEKALMRRYLGGEVEAFEALYGEFAPAVHGYLLRRLANTEDADELLQAVFLKFHRSRELYDFRHPVLAWLYVIARSALVDLHRHRGRHLFRPVPPQEMQGEEGDIPWEGVDDHQKQLIEWRFLDEESYEEIARRLGKSEESARQAVSRALKKIRAYARKQGSKT